MTQIACLSDIHGHLPEVRPADVLVLAGDVCPTTDHHPARQAAWLNGPFRRWLDSLPVKHIIGIAGNHDWVFQLEPYLVPRDLRWTYLQDSGAEVCGLRFYGSPWTKRFNNWAFNLDEEDLAVRWSLIPNDVDVLVTHGPPHGTRDLARRPQGGFEYAGSPSLADRLDELPNLRLHVFGHIHGGAGVTKVGGLTSVNAAYLDDDYLPKNPPRVVVVDVGVSRSGVLGVS